MATIRVSTVLPAPPERVWADIEDIASHVEWMADAVTIEFFTDQTRGVGTRFDCATRIGPFRSTDTMVITEWEPGRSIGVAHTGAVSGQGRFTFDPLGADETEFTWQESLRFPWWMGGRAGAIAAAPVFRWIWRRNLSRLRARFEDRGRSVE